jgi:hypothetical protein
VIVFHGGAEREERRPGGLLLWVGDIAADETQQVDRLGEVVMASLLAGRVTRAADAFDTALIQFSPVSSILPPTDLYDVPDKPT